MAELRPIRTMGTVPWAIVICEKICPAIKQTVGHIQRKKPRLRDHISLTSGGWDDLIQELFSRSFPDPFDDSPQLIVSLVNVSCKQRIAII